MRFGFHAGVPILLSVNAAAILSLCAAALQLGMGLLLLGLARAPGWRAARTFALIALTAAAYSATDLLFALPSASDDAVVWAARSNYCMASLHAAAWLLYTFGGPTASFRRLPRFLKALALVLAAGGFSILLTSVSHVPGQWTDVNVAWAGVQYHTPTPSPFAEWYGTFVLAAFTVPFFAFVPRALRRQPGALAHLVGFVVFFACLMVELLVTNGTISTLFLGDLGFLAVVIPVVAATVRRVVADARQLDSLSRRLAGEVEERTEALDRAQFALLEAERHAALGRLAAGVGHEINNPLTYLGLSLEGIEAWASTTSLPIDVREALESARDGAERIRQVVDGLRNYTRTTAGEHRALSPASLARSALRVASHQLQHVVTIETDLQPTPLVIGDEPRLVQVIVNLLTNASQAIVEARLAREVTITVRTFTLADERVVIEVKDEGPGIAPEDLRRLAEPYFTTRANTGGTGLGLFLARGIIEQHQGRLDIESILGVGTSARVVLPPAAAAVVDDVASTIQETAIVNVPLDPASDEGVSDFRARVLLIDDEPMVARVMARALAPHCDVSVTASGTEAIALLDRAALESHPIDAVLCDLMMPGMSGIEFAALLAVRDPMLRRRTLFLTGGAVTAAAEEFLEREDVHYLTKPIQTKELVGAIQRATRA